MSIRERIALGPKRPPLYDGWGLRIDGRAQMVKSSELLEEVEREIAEVKDRFVSVSVFRQELLFTKCGGLQEHCAGEKAEAPR